MTDTPDDYKATNQFRARSWLTCYALYYVLYSDLTPLQQLHVTRLCQIINGADEPQDEIELTFTNVVNELERMRTQS
jgi:hypothetical protein